MPLVKASQLERSEVDIPDTVVDFLQADIFADTDDGDVDPVAFPANTAIGKNIKGRHTFIFQSITRTGPPRRRA